MSYAVTGVMMDVSEVTLADMAGWWPTTHVLWDMLIELGWHPLAARRVFINAEVAPFTEVDRNGEPTLFGLAGPVTYDTSDWPQALELLQSMKEMLESNKHSDCPLFECEKFRGQSIFPKARARSAWAGLDLGAANGDQTIVHVSRDDGATWVQLSPAPPLSPARAREQLQAARPKKRLDGRRRR